MATRAENVVKFGRVVSELCEWTEKQTDRLITILHTPRERNNEETDSIFSARSNIYISRLCCDVSVRLSVRLSVCL